MAMIFWKENADTQIRLIDNFARILTALNIKFQLLNYVWKIKYDKIKEYINNSFKNRTIIKEK
ncbi:hypothetical protein HYE15_00885 [Mycoplasmopsis bovis]|nr:hypothetical protein [Mycoplasmopsis bovis]QQH25503.1 hypothetical protein HYE15_00885 [Mycoplasmopsis bovis]